MNSFITYIIVGDLDNKLKKTAKLACNFWNRFVSPKSSIVIRLGVFTSEGFTIARAYKPYSENGTRFGRVEFNTKYLEQFTDYDIAGTIIHEVGHTLGFGWSEWMELFDHESGLFESEYIQMINDLQYMVVETEYGQGTRFSHWDEERFDKELMTGFKDHFEYVLPVTIKVMRLLGHSVLEELAEKTDLETLIKDVENVVFSKINEAKALNLDYFAETELLEEVYAKAI